MSRRDEGEMTAALCAATRCAGDPPPVCWKVGAVPDAQTAAKLGLATANRDTGASLSEPTETVWGENSRDQSLGEVAPMGRGGAATERWPQLRQDV